MGFAARVVLVLCLFFLPVPSFLIDFGLAFSIAISVLILMVALWIQRPLEFSAFPTVLLVATVLRLALNISTTRLILSHGVRVLPAPDTSSRVSRDWRWAATSSSASSSF